MTYTVIGKISLNTKVFSYYKEWKYTLESLGNWGMPAVVVLLKSNRNKVFRSDEGINASGCS